MAWGKLAGSRTLLTKAFAPRLANLALSGLACVLSCEYQVLSRDAFELVHVGFEVAESWAGSVAASVKRVVRVGKEFGKRDGVGVAAFLRIVLPTRLRVSVASHSPKIGHFLLAFGEQVLLLRRRV